MKLVLARGAKLYNDKKMDHQHEQILLMGGFPVNMFFATNVTFNLNYYDYFYLMSVGDVTLEAHMCIHMYERGNCDSITFSFLLQDHGYSHTYIEIH